jgi:hypothetical protein
MKRSDFILIAVLAVIALSALGLMRLAQMRAIEQSEALLAEIYVEGALYETVDLAVPDVIEIKTDKGYNFLRIEDGHILIYDADCRDQICVETKAAKAPGDTIVCLPHEVLIQIKGTRTGGELDAVSQ